MRDMHRPGLLLAAFEPELEAFAEGAMPMATVGVGLVEAALGTTVALARFEPPRVCLVGTVGAYPGSGLRPGDLVAAGTVSLGVDGAEIPMVMPRCLSAEPFVGFSPSRVATTLGITVCALAAERLGLQFDVEHMEAFAVARACQVRGVRFSAVFVVANHVGPEGRSEWLSNHQAVSHKLARALIPVLKHHLETF
jgi:futalosine hydrolase